MSTGQRLDLVLRNKKITQEDLASQSEVSRQTINNIIKGKSAPSGEVLAKIIGVLPDLNLNWLVSGKGEMIISNESQSELEDPLTAYHAKGNQRINEEARKEVEKLKEIIKEKDKTIEALKETISTQKTLINRLMR